MQLKKGLTPSPHYTFAGGLVTMVAKTRLLPSQLIKAKNINLSVNGEWAVRKGFEHLSTVEFGTEIDRMIHYKTTAYDKIIAYGDKYVKRLDIGTPDVWTQLSDTMSVTEDYRSMVIAGDKLYIADTAGVKKYIGGGSALLNAGIVAPDAACTATAGGGSGTWTGKYTYYTTFLNSATGEESDPSPISNEIEITLDTHIHLTGIDTTTDPQVDKVNIYRNANGVTGQWWYVAQINEGTTIWGQKWVGVMLLLQVLRFYFGT
jgi:hypothetical protein